MRVDRKGGLRDSAVSQGAGGTVFPYPQWSKPLLSRKDCGEVAAITARWAIGSPAVGEALSASPGNCRLAPSRSGRQGRTMPDLSLLARDVGRRALLGSLAGGVAALTLSGRPARAAGSEFTPEAFGARGDGAADDYAAFVRLAAAVSGTRGANVRFARGARYRIDRVQIRGGPRRNDVAAIPWERCVGLTLDLNGATLEVKGDFHRSGDTNNGRQSFVNAVEPFLFRQCSDLVVRNGILNGNADRMTRDATVVERGGRAIIIAGCTRVLLENLHIHHFSTDGVSIRPGSDGRVSRDVRLERVRLTNNARQGLTNGGGVQVMAIDCAFSENGFTGGPYRHAPSAGVDIEPNGELDLRSDFRALRCRFDNNRGAPVVCASPDRGSTIELIDCGGVCESRRRMILTAERTRIVGGSWHNVQIACAWSAHRRFRHGIEVEVTGGLWAGDDPRWGPIYDLSPQRPRVFVHGNRFRLLAREPFVPAYLFQCANPNHRFEGNEIFVSESGHAGSGDDLIAQFAGAVVAGNRWSTDARAPLRFVNNYQRAARVERESFSGSFAGIGMPG